VGRGNRGCWGDSLPGTSGQTAKGPAGAPPAGTNVDPARALPDVAGADVAGADVDEDPNDLDGFFWSDHLDAFGGSSMGGSERTGGSGGAEGEGEGEGVGAREDEVAESVAGVPGRYLRVRWLGWCPSFGSRRFTRTTGLSR